MMEDIRSRRLTNNAFPPLKGVMSQSGPVRTDSRGRHYLVAPDGSLRRWDKLSQEQQLALAERHPDFARLLVQEVEV